jgi:hypothetical protein
MTSTTDTLLDRLREDRTLSPQVRFDLLIEAADVDLLRDIVAANLNYLEKKVILALALPWPEGEPRATDLALVLKERAGPRANPNPKAKEMDIATQLQFLVQKEWVHSDERDDGVLFWRLL